MEGSPDRDRKIVPRWRALDRTPALELESACSPFRKFRNDSQALVLRALYEQWRTNPTFDNALVVVDSATMVKDPFLAVGPANMILGDERAMPATRSVAEAIVKGPRPVNLESTLGDIRRVEVQERIRAIKKRLREEPRNGLLWLERARLYTLVGDLTNSELSLHRALGAAPNNRFVLRAFARYMTHVGRPDEAHDRLLKCRGLRNDPWLQAAEIATADAAGRGPTSVRAAREVLSRGGLTPNHTTEVAAALGSLEAANGRTKKSKRLFELSLIQPNDNSLSQAFWARDEMRMSVPIKNSMLGIDGAFEARVQAASAEAQWQAAATSCMDWLKDEPFSLTAAIAGSYIAASHLWDQEMALTFCDLGLVANPGNKILLNNKVVSFCRAGRNKEAELEISKIKHYSVGTRPNIVIMATMGLLAFRQGNILEGRNWYQNAAKTAKQSGNVDATFRVLFHWFYEEARAGTLVQDVINKMIFEIDKSSKIPELRIGSVKLWESLKDRVAERKFVPQAVAGDYEQPQFVLL